MAFNGSRRFIHGDKALEKLAGPQADVATIYAASLGLRLEAKGQLFMDRMQCHECDQPEQKEHSVAEMILNAQFHEAPNTSTVVWKYWDQTKGSDGESPSCPKGEYVAPIQLPAAHRYSFNHHHHCSSNADDELRSFTASNDHHSSFRS